MIFVVRILMICSIKNLLKKLNTLKKLYLALKYEMPEIKLDDETILKAEKPILKMLELSV